MPIQLSIKDINARKPAKSRLTAIKEVAHIPRSGGYFVRQILYRCDCGNMRIASPTEVGSGSTLSCGCLRKDKIPPNKKYNMSHYRLKGVYFAMISRCYNPKNAQYKTYGGRGVKVCSSWKSNAQSFFDWAVKGYKHGLQLDKDSNGLGKLYSPKTCRWVTHAVNQQNTSRSNKVLYKGRMVNITHLEKMTGIPDETLKRRIGLGLTAEQAVAQKKYGRVKGKLLSS